MDKTILWAALGCLLLNTKLAHGQRLPMVVPFIDADIARNSQSPWEVLSTGHMGLKLIAASGFKKGCLLPTMDQMGQLDLLAAFPKRTQQVMRREAGTLGVLDDLKKEYDKLKNDVNDKKKELVDLTKTAADEVSKATTSTLNTVQTYADNAYQKSLDKFNDAMADAFDFATCLPCPGAFYDVFLRWDCPSNPLLSHPEVKLCRDQNCIKTRICDCWPGETWRFSTDCDTEGTLSMSILHRSDSPCTRISMQDYKLTVQCADGHVMSNSKCRQCTSAIDCNNHAASVDSIDDSKCLCSCSAGYVGEQCDLCAPGYIRLSNNDCIKCTISHTCSGKADFVEEINNECKCYCRPGYAPSMTDHVGGLACTGCADTFVDPTCSTQCTTSHCNSRGTASAVPALSATVTPLNQTCSCDCWNWYSGDTCEMCSLEFSGINCDECAPAHVLDPPGCDVDLSCTNCTFRQTGANACTGCRKCTAMDCNFHAKLGGITTDEDSRNCVCICSNQWVGDACEKCPLIFEQTGCGMCAPGRNQTTFPLCACNNNFYGDNCDKCDEKFNKSLGCSVCADNRDQSLYPACPCVNEYFGTYCDKCAPEHHPEGCDRCSMGRNESTFPVCECNNMYYGEQCDKCDNKYALDCSRCAARRNQDLFPACPCLGSYVGDQCETCPSKYDAASPNCDECAKNRVAYPLCECAGMYTGAECMLCEDKYNDTCNGCRYVPQNQYSKGCFPCSDSTHVMDAMGFCWPCPEGLLCDGSMVTRVQPGWWRDAEYFCGGRCEGLPQDLCTNTCTWGSSTCRDVNASEVFCGMFIRPSRCHTPHCNGTLGVSLAASENICVNGTNEMLCGVCGPDSVLSNGKCHECRSPSMERFIAIGGIMVAIAGSLAFVYISFPKTIKKKALFLRAMKQMVTHLQVLAVFVTLKLPWGTVLDTITSSAESISSVGSNPAAFLCVAGSATLADTTLFWLFAIPAILLLMAAVSAFIFGRSAPKGEEKKIPPKKDVIELCFLCRGAWGEIDCEDCRGVRCRACAKICRAQDHNQKEIVNAEGGAKVLPQKRNVFINAGVVLYFLAWSNTVKELVRPLSCTEYSTQWGNEESVVTSDVRLECGGPIMALAALGVTIHTAVLPVLLAVFLRMIRSSLQEFQWVSSLGFMYVEYRRRYCWWESTVLLRKGLLILIANGSEDTSVKVYSMVVVFLFFLTLNVMCRPFRDPVQQHLESLSLVTLLGTILTGEWIVHNEATPTQDVLVHISVVMNIIFFVVWIAVMVHAMLAVKLDRKECPVEKEMMELPVDDELPRISRVDSGFVEDDGSDDEYESDDGSLSSAESLHAIPSASHSAADSLLTKATPPESVSSKNDVYRRFGV